MICHRKTKQRAWGERYQGAREQRSGSTPCTMQIAHTLNTGLHSKQMPTWSVGGRNTQIKRAISRRVGNQSGDVRPGVPQSNLSVLNVAFAFLPLRTGGCTLHGRMDLISRFCAIAAPFPFSAEGTFSRIYRTDSARMHDASWMLWSCGSHVNISCPVGPSA